MEFDFLSQAKKLLHEQKKYRHYLAVCLCLGAVVVFGTVAALRMSGRALTENVLDCQYDVHEHTEECYAEEEDGRNTLTCGYADYAVHMHGEECYEKGGDLICPLPEVSVHEHTDDCYEEREIVVSEEEASVLPEVHEHTEDCYETGQDDLVCSMDIHIHGEACYEKELNCKEEGHIHTEECYPEEGADPVCGKEEDGHEHTDSCYEKTLICKTEEHEHTDGCYEEKQVLICTADTDGSREGSHTKEQVGTRKILVCEEPELHTHDDGCYEEDRFDENGDLKEGSVPVCGLLQLEEHEHSDACFREKEASAEEPAESEDEESILKKEFVQEQEEGTFKVIATYGRDAEIPKDAELVVEVLTEETEEALYEERMDAARELSGRQDASAELLYHIGFYVDGEEIEPQGTVNIEFQMYQDGIKAGAPVTVVHFDGDGPKVLESTDMTQNEDGSLSTCFDSDSFSPFAIIVGGEEEKLVIGILAGEQIVYAESDRTSDSFPLKEYEPRPEQPLRIRILETKEDAAGEKWYRYVSLTEDEALKEQMERYPYVLAADVLPEEGYVKRTLSAVDERGVVITVEGFLPEEAELTIRRIFDPEIADVVEEMELQLEDFSSGLFRMVYDLDLGLISPLPLPVKVSFHSLSLEYKDYGNLSARTYRMCADKEADDAEQLKNRTDKLDTEMKEEGEIIFETDRFSVFYIAMDMIEGGEYYLRTLAERGNIENHTWEEDTGYFQEDTEEEAALIQMPFRTRAAYARSGQSSKVQIPADGGGGTKEKDGVKVSKTIQGTGQENIFDITLQVNTNTNILNLTKDPDMAVVIVLDVSNTMNYAFGGDHNPTSGNSRYASAMNAASTFIDQFCDHCVNDVSRIGFVAFNTDAHQIFNLSSCSTPDQANGLKLQMKTGTEKILGADEYKSDWKRFTNAEAGLKMAQDMIQSAGNKNKYIIFLSDGFPTTYIANGYSGYNPEASIIDDDKDIDGVFYDSPRKLYCSGTDYSDKAAIKAREKAEEIKKSGVKIFSVGIDIGGQSIKKYLDSNANRGLSVSTVDRRSESYEIGGADDPNAYEAWLQNKIGSGEGFYCGGEDAKAVSEAFNNIFLKLKGFHEQTMQSIWIAEDPMPTVQGSARYVEFLGFYDRNSNFIASPGSLSGSNGPGLENTADFNDSKKKINWDLKRSGYTSKTEGKKTIYTYTLTYRVRLKNESSSKNAVFQEGTVYLTNDTTKLSYQTITTTNGTTTVSSTKNIEFPIPKVQGYLADFSFAKTDRGDNAVSGATFTLKHDTEHCTSEYGKCRADGKSSVNIGLFTAVSGKNGKVSFQNIPSGHQYILQETAAPEGYVSYGEKYTVKVAYDKLTIKDAEGNDVTENLKVVNARIYKLPKSGGPGTPLCTAAGVLIAVCGAGLLICRRKVREKRG